MVDAVEANTGRKPVEISVDAGYCSDDNLEALERRGIRRYIATGRRSGRAPQKDGGAGVGADGATSSSRAVIVAVIDCASNCRAGVRADQAGRGLSAVPSNARAGQGRPRVGPGLPRPQRDQNARPRGDSAYRRVDHRMIAVERQKPSAPPHHSRPTPTFTAASKTIWTGS